MATQFISNSVPETYKFAREMAGKMGNHRAILLSGDLGAGKTTFTRGFVSFWGLEESVSSPTFTILNEYTAPGIRICHFDLYRLNSFEEVEELGLEDYLFEADYSLVEWPDIAIPAFDFPVITLKVYLGENENQRIFDIEGA